MTGLFRVIVIETCNTCTRRCWFCKFGQERQDGAISQMDRGTIKKILENLRDLDYSGRISWYNINEPLMDRRMAEIVRMTREYCPRSFISLATNGDLLDEALYRDLKAGGLDALGVSVYDDRIYEKVRVFADRQMVLMDMRKITEGMLDNRGGNIRRNEPFFEHDRDRYRNRPCERPDVLMVVNSRGQVVLCCDDLYGDVVMGDIHSQRLEQIWNNEKFAAYRTALSREGRRNLLLCSECSYSGEGVRPFFPFFDKKPSGGISDRIHSGLGRIWSRFRS